MIRILGRELVLIVLIAVAGYFAPAALLFGRQPSTYAVVAPFMVLPVMSSYALASALVNRGRRAPTWFWWALGLLLYVLSFWQVVFVAGEPTSTTMVRVVEWAPLVAPWVLGLIALLVSPRSRWARVFGRTLVLYAVPMAVTRFLLAPIINDGAAMFLSLSVTTLYLVLRILWGVLAPLKVDHESA